MTTQKKWLLPDGVDELLHPQAIILEKVRRYILDLYQRWGYQFVMPPLIEFSDSLLVGLGDDLADQTFLLTDQVSGKSMAIRADITSQVARIDAHSMKSGGINRLCYAGSVLHARPKAIMASRCPILSGAELYGNASIDADIEVISLMLETLEGFNNQEDFSVSALNGLTLDIGHVVVNQEIEKLILKADPGIDNSELAEIFEAVQRKSKQDLSVILNDLSLDQDVILLLCELTELCGGADVLNKARSLFEGRLNIESSLIEIEKVIDVISLRFPEINIYVDLAEFRGYNYHTGLTFAAFAEGHGLAIANGGRYDHVGEVFGATRPATGFNVNLKPLIKLLAPEFSLNEVILAPNIIGDKSLWDAINQLRSQGLTVVLEPCQDNLQPGKRLEKVADVWQVV